MATYYFDPDAAGGGDGSLATPYNSFASYTTGAHRYLLKRGATFRETFTFAAGTNSSYLGAYGDGPMPIIDCENSRSNGIDLNSRTNCEVTGIRVINQNAAPTNAAIRVSGSGHNVHHCEVANSQVGIHVNASAGNRIHNNHIDAGNPLTPSIAYGIRINAVGSTGNVVEYNEVTSTAEGMTFISSIQVYAGGSGNRIHRNYVHDILADGPSLRSGTTGCYMTDNLVCGARILDALVCEGSSGNFIWGNTAVNAGDVDGHFGPALKMGDEFGAGTPSTTNDIANNLFISLGANNVMNLVTVGTGNTFRNNRLWRPSGGDIINLNDGGGTAALTFAEWQAEGYSTNETFGDPQVSAGFVPMIGSPLVGAGVHVAYTRDFQGKQRPNPPSIGAYDVATLRPVLTSDPA